MSIETKTRAFVNKSMPERDDHGAAPRLGDERVQGGGGDHRGDGYKTRLDVDHRRIIIVCRFHSLP